MLIQLLLFILYFFLGFILLSAIIYLKYSVLNDYKIRKQLSELNSKTLPTYENFTIKNPYNRAGTYYKAQLHVHSTNSDGDLSPDELASTYKELGYTFLAITDHDKLTLYSSDDPDFILISGEEMTHSRPFWPLGHHISRLFVDKRPIRGSLQAKIDQTHSRGGMIVINHPSFIGNLGTQKWIPEQLIQVKNFYLMEIANHYTTTVDNIYYWHGLMKKFGSQRPIWAVGSDDTHRKEDIDQNYIMVQVEEVSQAGLAKALLAGNFYPTQGPTFKLNVSDRHLTVCTNPNTKITFVDASLKIRKEITDTQAKYQFNGDEGFIRVEIEEIATGKKAWSQPLWIIEETAEELEQIQSAS